MEPKVLLGKLGGAWLSPETPTGWMINCPVHPDVTAKISHLKEATCPKGCTYADFEKWVTRSQEVRVVTPEVPVDVFPERIAAALRRGHENTGAPLAYFALGALPVLATALGSHVRVAVRPGWNERACFNVALMGASGTGKDPALNMLIGPLEKAESKLRHGFKRTYAEWEKADKKERGDPPVMYELLQQDATTEAMCEALDANQNALLQYDGELVGMVRAIGQYKPNGSGNDRQIFLSYWSGTAIKVRRRGKPPLVVESPTVNILGGLQDGMFDALAGEDGLRARFLFAVGERKVSTTFFGEPCGSWEDDIYPEWTALIEELLKGRNKGSPLLIHLSKEAQALSEPFLLRLDNYLGIGNGDLPEMYRKAKGYLFRVSLVLYVVDCVVDGTRISEGEISEDVMRRSLRVMDWCNKSGQYFFRDDDGSTPYERAAAERMDKLAAWIEEKKNDGKEITGRYLQNYGPRWVKALPARKREELREMMGYDVKWEKREW